jgi:hypothetical protein
MSPENSGKWRSDFWNADGWGTPQNPIRVRSDGFRKRDRVRHCHSPSLLLAIPTDLRRQLDKKFLHSAVTLIDGLIGVCRKNEFQLAGGRRHPASSSSWWRSASAQSPSKRNGKNVKNTCPSPRCSRARDGAAPGILKRITLRAAPLIDSA